LEDGKLNCTGIVRMQNANILIKNIHFFATYLIDQHVLGKELKVSMGEFTHFIMNVCFDWLATFFATLIGHVAKELKVPVGEYTHFITNVCLHWSATSC
jgi:thymidylate synthase